MSGGKVMSKLTTAQVKREMQRLELGYLIAKSPGQDERDARRLVSLHEIAEIGGVTLRRFDRLTADDRRWLGLETAT